MIAAVSKLLSAESFFSTIYLSHSDCGGEELDVREGRRTKQKQTRTPPWDSNSPRRIRHSMSCGIKARMASERGKKKEKAQASTKNFVKNNGKFSLPHPLSSPAPYFLFCVFCFQRQKIFERTTGNKAGNFSPQSLPPSLAAQPDS